MANISLPRDNNRDANGRFKKDSKRPKIWYDKAKSKMSKENNPNWKGGFHQKTRAKYAPRPKSEQCEVCGAIGRICYDHDHETGEFRGWICHRCNSVLGFVKDNGELLIMLKSYLNKSRKHD